MMKKTIAIIGFIMLTGFATAKLVTDLPTNENSLNKILNSDKIEITIINHGGYGASEIGRNKLILEKDKNASDYLAKYDDKLNLNTSKFKVNHMEMESLKNVFLELISIHQANKKLNGDCVVIDKNFVLTSKGNTMVIQPMNISLESYKFDNWIHKSTID